MADQTDASAANPKDSLNAISSHQVNRMLKELQAEGLTERLGRAVTFPDPNGLQAFADFNERYLHLTRQTT